ncbi:MAG: hypothetical protein AVDCRST_MAG54-1188, partial [uncultured Actinomycetospora sp.]
GVEPTADVEGPAPRDLHAVVGRAHRPEGEVVRACVDDDHARARDPRRELGARPRHGVGEPGRVRQPGEADGLGEGGDALALEVAGDDHDELLGVPALGARERREGRAELLHVAVDQLRVDGPVVLLVDPHRREGCGDRLERQRPPIHVSPSGCLCTPTRCACTGLFGLQ